MKCAYCDGTGGIHDAVKGITADCDACCGSGRATCQECGADAGQYDDERGDICAACLELDPL